MVSPLSGRETFTLTGLSGKRVWSGTDIEKKDLSFLPRGVYFLTVSAENTVQTIKLIK
jgi:hypothetical protein